MKVLRCKLLTYRNDPGDYTIYVFQNVETLVQLDKYIMCTKCPNWQTPPIQIGQEGFLKYKEIIAGRDMWYDSNSKESIPYKYSGNQFYDFVLDRKKEKLECVMT